MTKISKTDWVIGRHAVEMLFKHTPERLLEVMVQVGRENDFPFLAQIKQQGLAVTSCSRAALDQQTGDSRHQGLAARCRPAKAYDEDWLFQHLLVEEKNPLLLILDGVQDPHNLGACLRVADGAGVHAVIAPKDRAVSLNATVRKVASGAAEVVPFVAVTNLARAMRELQEQGVWLVGLDAEATATLYDAKLEGPLGLVLGAEGSGLRRLTREHCDELISIPMHGQISSLNVSVAASVCVFEAVRQRA